MGFKSFLCATLVVCITLVFTFTPTNAVEYSTEFYDSNGGQYMALLTSGDVDDFGYNYIINAGRVAMEYQLNMSNTLFVPNILDNVSAIAYATDLVHKGYRLIISCTISHGNAMMVLATAYPNVTFVQYGIKSGSVPNLSDLVWANSEFWWAVGVFAGATTTNDKVGFIHPGETEGSISSINAFYSGVMWANSSLKVYTMYTGAYIAVDRANGACAHLINDIGVGALTGQQDDLTVPIAAKNAGLLAIGVTGYSLRQLYGELVGVSFLRDWTAALVTYSVAVNGNIFKSDITKYFKNGGQFLDQKSHLVTDAQWATVQAGIAQLNAGKQPFYCGEWMSEFGLNNATGCVNASNTGLFSLKVLSNISTLGYYNIPLTDDAFSSSTRIGLIVTAAILLAIPVIFAIAVIILRDNREIRAGSPFFFLVMIVGCALVYVGVIVWPLNPSVGVCRARIWLPSLGATIALSALFTKNVRIYLLFFNPFKFSADRLSIRNFFPIVVGMVVMDAIILAVYSGAGPKGVTIQQGVDGLGPYETRHICQSTSTGNSIIYAILAFHMFQCAAGCIISFLLRNVTNPEFDERKAVGMSIYVVTFCLVIVSVLIGVTDISNKQLVLFVSLALLICNTAVLFIIFGSRFVDVFVGEAPQVHLPKKGGQSGGSAGSGRSANSSARSNSAHSHSAHSHSDVDLGTSIAMKDVTITTNV